MADFGKVRRCLLANRLWQRIYMKGIDYLELNWRSVPKSSFVGWEQGDLENLGHDWWELFVINGNQKLSRYLRARKVIFYSTSETAWALRGARSGLYSLKFE